MSVVGQMRCIELHLPGSTGVRLSCSDAQLSVCPSVYLSVHPSVCLSCYWKRPSGGSAWNGPAGYLVEVFKSRPTPAPRLLVYVCACVCAPYVRVCVFPRVRLRRRAAVIRAWWSVCAWRCACAASACCCRGCGACSPGAGGPFSCPPPSRASWGSWAWPG